uniref:Lipase_3 domain-containing protein n=1 Tax=Panagrellus redivivus TaxID=6233 RepID=A0A7E4VYW1_PANRE
MLGIHFLAHFIIICSQIFGTSTTLLSDYSDRLVRSNFFPLASAAYASTPLRCLKDLHPDAQLVHQYTVHCVHGKIHICSGYLAYSKSEKTIYLVFKGYESANHADAQYKYTQVNWPNAIKIKDKTVNVNPYFYSALKRLMETGMERDVTKVIQKYPRFALWITGHSLGGSLASIAAGVVAHKRYAPSNNVYLVTFGEPKTGDLEFARTIESIYSKRSWRVTHRNDIVPAQASQVLKPSPHDPFVHHNREYWYNNTMTPREMYIVCDRGDSINSVRSLAKHTWADHWNYFNVPHTFATKGCSNKHLREIKLI